MAVKVATIESGQLIATLVKLALKFILGDKWLANFTGKELYRNEVK